MTGGLETIDEAELAKIRDVLASHSVSFAVVFGSAARGEMDVRSDLDIAVEFERLRPDDDGYSDAYLGVRSDLAEMVSMDVDVVDVHRMSPSFARVVFDEGRMILGSAERRDALRDAYAGAPPSLEDARDRVAAVADRLRENV